MENFKTTAVLAALAVALAVGALVADSANRRVTETGARILFEFDKDQVARLEIAWPGSDRPGIVAERAAGTWTLLEPLKGPGSPQELDRVAGYLSTLKATARWSESDDAVAAQAAERLVVKAVLKDGTEHWAKLGGLTGSEFMGYGRVSSADGIWEISKGMWDAADRPLVEFRDRRLFSVDYFDLDGLEFVRGEKTFRIFKRDESWIQEEPFPDDADAYVLFEFLSQIEKAHALAFVAEEPGPADLKRFGLDAPEGVVTLHGKGRVSTVAFGRAAGPEGGEDVWYARRADRTPVVKVDPLVGRETLVDDPHHFRRRFLVPDPGSWEAREVEVKGSIEGAAVDFRAKYDPQFKRWELTAPVERTLDPADSGLWSRFLKERVTELSARAFVAENVPAAELEARYGLGPSALRLTYGFLNAKGARSVTIHVGRDDPSEGIAYARVEGRPNVVGVDMGIRKDLSWGFVRFLNRQLVDIDPAAVKWVEYSAGGRTARWEQRADGFWVATLPEGAGTVPSSRMEAALGFDLKQAQKYICWVDDPAKLPAEYGLTPPREILKICWRTGRATGAPTRVTTLFFGEFFSGESLYARYEKGDFDTGDLVFIVGRSARDLLFKMLQEALEAAEKKDKGK